MIDTVLALFIVWILVFIVGVLRRGITWGFLDLVIVITMFYEGASIVLVVILLLINTLTLYFFIRGEDEEW